MNGSSNTLDELRKLKMQFSSKESLSLSTARLDGTSMKVRSPSSGYDDDAQSVVSYASSKASTANRSLSKLTARKNKMKNHGNGQTSTSLTSRTVVDSSEENTPNAQMLNEKKYWISRIADENQKLMLLIQVSTNFSLFAIINK